MTVPIKFKLSPQGTSNSLKFAHEQLLNQVFIDKVVTGLIATGYQFMELSPAIIITPSITSIKYKVEHNKRYLPLYQVRSMALQPLPAGNSRLIFTTDDTGLVFS